MSVVNIKMHVSTIIFQKCLKIKPMDHLQSRSRRRPRDLVKPGPAAQTPRDQTMRALTGDRMLYSTTLMTNAASFGDNGDHGSSNFKTCIFGLSQTHLYVNPEASQLNL
jgi:hypothetical protein